MACTRIVRALAKRRRMTLYILLRPPSIEKPCEIADDKEGGLEAVVEEQVHEPTEWLICKTLYERSGLLVRHSTNGEACSYDTLRTEWLVCKTLYERSGLFVRHSTTGVACLLDNLKLEFN